MADDTVKPIGPDADKPDISTPCIAYQSMADRFSWDLVQDLLGGTKSMRAAEKKWLPMEQKESKLNYNARLNRTVLFNAFKTTIDKLVSKPFSRSVGMQGTLPDRVQPVWENPDRAGTSITTFAKNFLTSAVQHGLSHVFVDYPDIPEGTNLAVEKAMGDRATFILIKAPDLFFWADETDTAGRQYLTEIRFKECRTEPDGEFGQKEVYYVRRVTRTTWEVWQETKDPKTKAITWKMTQNGTHSFGEVPLKTLYTKREAFMTAEPPLLEMAWLNLTHWQSSSDQRNILRVARCGILFGAGFTKEELDKGLTVGPNSLVGSTNPLANLKYVEHTGAAVDAGQNDLKNIEDKMEIMGLQPLVENTGRATATGAAINEERAASSIQTWIQDCEAALVECFEMAGQWVGQEVPEAFQIDIFSDFGLSLRAVEDQNILTLARKQGDLDRGTYLRELKRRGTLSEDTDIDKVQAAIEAEGPDLAEMGLQPGTVPAPGTPPAKPGTPPAKPVAPPTSKNGPAVLPAA